MSMEPYGRDFALADPGRDRTQPPYDLNAEAALIGSVLKSPGVMDRQHGRVLGEHFWKPQNRHVWDAMRSLHEQGIPSDYNTVADELQKLGTYEASGGLLYLSEMNMATPTAAHADHYASIILGLWGFRRLISVASTAAEWGFRATGDLDEQLTRVQDMVAAITEKISDAGIVGPEQWAPALLARTEERVRQYRENPGKLVGAITSGLETIDDMVEGLRPKMVYLVPADTSVGKTQLMMQICWHVAQEHGDVALFTLEMSETELTDRLATITLGVDQRALVRGTLGDSELNRLRAATPDLSSTPLHFIQEKTTAASIATTAARLHARSPLQLIAIDYAQLLEDDDGNNTTERLDKASKRIKAMARRLNVPVLLLAQLNRQFSQRGDKRPTINDIRATGALAQDADVVIAPYRHELYETVKPEEKGLTELLLLKNRGPGDARDTTDQVRWDHKYRIYRDLPKQQAPVFATTNELPFDR